MKRNRSVRVWSVFKLGLALLLFAAAVDQSASAQDSAGTTTSSSSTSTSEPDPTPPEAEEHPFGTVYPPGSAAVTYDQMSAKQKQGPDQAAAWADTKNGHQVHTAWSAYAHKMAAQAQVKRVAYQAGVNGLDSVGVAP